MTKRNLLRFIITFRFLLFYRLFNSHFNPRARAISSLAGYREMNKITTLDLKRHYERYPVGEAKDKDTVFRFKQICIEIGELNWKDRLLEVGCGKGTLGLFVSVHCSEYVGVDFSVNALKHAKKLGKDNMSYVCADASFLPFKEDVFNIVLCSEVLEHIPKYTKVLPECFSILKPRGKLLITVPNRYNPTIFLSVLLTGKGIGGQAYDNPPPFFRLLRQLVENGFKIEKFYSFYSFLDLSYIIPRRIIKHITSLVYFTQKILTTLLTLLTTLGNFPFALYIFVRSAYPQDNKEIEG